MLGRAHTEARKRLRVGVTTFQKAMPPKFPSVDIGPDWLLDQARLTCLRSQDLAIQARYMQQKFDWLLVFVQPCYGEKMFGYPLPYSHGHPAPSLSCLAHPARSQPGPMSKAKLLNAFCNRQARPKWLFRQPIASNCMQMAWLGVYQATNRAHICLLLMETHSFYSLHLKL